MKTSPSRRAFVLGMLALGLPARSIAQGFPDGLRDVFGPRFGAQPSLGSARPRRRGTGAGDRLRHWNEVAIDTSGVDHTPPPPGDPRVFGEQLGPGRSSRAMAIVHIALFDAMNAIVGGCQSYSGLRPAPAETSAAAAIALAAHDTLIRLLPVPGGRARRSARRGPERPSRRGRAKVNGIKLGRAAAGAILARRVDDGSRHPEPHVGVDFITSDAPGKWRQDPISLSPLCARRALGRGRAVRAPLGRSVPGAAATRSGQPRIRGRVQGGEGARGRRRDHPTARTADQTVTGIFWAYDGTPSLCAPPRLYNQIVMHIAEQRKTGPMELARLLALINVAMADAGIAIWESKYYYEFWRPVTGIREPDGNRSMPQDPTYFLSARPPVTSTDRTSHRRFPPTRPATPGSGAHCSRSCAISTGPIASRSRSFRTSSTARHATTTATCARSISKSFSTLSEAEEENGQSRIYLGIHWAFDKTEGIAQGRRVADYVFGNAFAAAPR